MIAAPASRLASGTESLRRPIFIVGTVRSGTTLLSRLLGHHPEVAWVHTGHAGYELAAEWCALAGIEMGVPGLGPTHCPALAKAAATPARTRRVREGFAAILAARSDKAGEVRFLNKNPHLWNKLSFLRRIFPDAALVVTSRDLRSTALSTQMLWLRLGKTWRVRHHLPLATDACWSCVEEGVQGLDAGRTFPGGEISVLAEYWLRTYEHIEAEAGRFATLVPVSHRRLIADPHGTLAAVCAALDLPPFEVPSEIVIDPNRNERWRHLLTSRERDELEHFIATHTERIGALDHADTVR